MGGVAHSQEREKGKCGPAMSSGLGRGSRELWGPSGWSGGSSQSLPAAPGPSGPRARERPSPRPEALAPGSSLSIHLPGMSRSLLHRVGEAAHPTRLHVAEVQPHSV